MKKYETADSIMYCPADSFIPLVTIKKNGAGYG